MHPLREDVELSDDHVQSVLGCILEVDFRLPGAAPQQSAPLWRSACSARQVHRNFSGRTQLPDPQTEDHASGHACMILMQRSSGEADSFSLRLQNPESPEYRDIKPQQQTTPMSASAQTRRQDFS